MGPSAPSPTLGSAQGGVRFQLVRSEGDAATPFVVLHEGRFSRIYLAEVRVDGGAAVSQFALKIQSDSYKPPAHGHGQSMTNPDIDELWQREIDDLARIDSPNVVRRVPAPESLLNSLPVVYCAKVGTYFHPVCAETGNLLSVCKDDEFLADRGLVKYSQDTWRYLHGGGGDRAARTFYRIPGATGERPRDGVVVRTGAELYRDWSRLVYAGAEDPVANKAKAALPCLACEHRGTCFPADPVAGRIPAEDHLHAVSFYDFRALPLQLLDVDYDQLCDLLGGIDFAEVSTGSGGSSRAQQELLKRFVPQYSGGVQWLFRGDPKRFPLEVLRLKLTAFQEVCEGLGALHLATGRPHFGIAPQNVMAKLVAQGRFAPARWGFQVQLVDLGGPVRQAHPGRSADMPSLLEPGPELREDLRMRPYYSPELQGLDGQSSSMAVQFRPAEASGDKVHIVLEAQGPANLKRFRVGDYVCVMPSSGNLSGDLGLWARIDELRQKGLLASAVVGKDSPCVRWAGRSLDATCSFFRNFGPPVDLYGLGMLLFRTLLVNDQQSMDDIEEVVAKCLRRLRDELSGGAVDERAVLARVQQFVGGKEVRARFEAQNVLQRRADRLEHQRAAIGDRDPIDSGLWHALLNIAFRLTTQFKGYSYSDSHVEGSPFLLRQVHADIESLRRRLQVDMFAAEARDTVIGTACAGVLEQLRSELLASPEAQNATSTGAVRRAEKGFRLTLQKDGETTSQEYNFSREQVTIGRREVENLVRLNDPMVSSAHAVIEKTPDGYVVIDRNSTNGTEVDGIRLPGDVPQPLQDGSVIRLRPFTMIFHTGSDRMNVTAVMQMVTTEQLAEQVNAEFAARLDAPAAEQLEALRQVLLKARPAMGAAGLLAKVEELGQRFRRGKQAEAASGDAQPAAKFFTSAHKALSHLATTLLGSGDFSKPDEIERFAQKLAQFVDATTHWIEGALLLRRELGHHLELGATGSGSISNVKTAADVRQLALNWSASSNTPEQAAVFLRKFFGDVQAMMEGLLAGAKTIRKAIRERLDPDRLVDQVGRGLMTNMAAGSALWKHYVEVFLDVAEGKQFELELDRLLQKSLQERRSGDRK